MSQIEALCTGKKKGDRKHPVSSAVFRTNYGIENDAHVGSWHRQVSILSLEDIESVRKNGLPNIKSGDFAENIILSGLELTLLGLGSRGRNLTSVLRLSRIMYGSKDELSVTSSRLSPSDLHVNWVPRPAPE